MKTIATLLLATVLALGANVAEAKDPIRLDGTTDSSFEKSFTKLVRSLNASERRTLAIGLFGALLQHECLAPEVVIRLTFSPVEPRDGQLIRACREHLDGMSYPEILQASEPPAKDPASELSNNTLETDA